ncbi:hypothetical protein [Microbacterium kyungheense]|uniref:hypothetical protein n=1 Tax=Microbacterium kyungheense TaxID=1263636 RepID=UPI00163D126B|nr:hypothetical protein [Microbacterium kyungheense]
MTTPPNTPPLPDPSAVPPQDQAFTADAAPAYAATPAYASAPAHAAAPAPGAVGPKNTIGLIALIVAVATLVLSTVTLVSQAVLMMQSDYDYVLINLVTTVLTSIGGLLSLAAVVLGAIGLAKKGAPKGAAGVGLGIGIATVWAILGNLIFSALVSLVY